MVVAVFGSLNILFIRQSTQRALKKEIDKRSLELALSLEERSTKLLLYEDMIALQQYFDKIMEKDQDVSYVFIMDKSNHVLVHTFGLAFPVELTNANSLQSGELYHFQVISDEHNNLYRDVVVPVFAGNLGYLRLGMSEENIDKTVRTAVFIGTGMVLVFLIIGIAGAVLFAYWITNPLSTITNAFEKMTFNEEFQPLNINAKDEIGILAGKFNEMAFRLQTAHTNLKNAQKKLIQTEKLASVGTITSGLAHEINNPLAGLRNCLIRIKKKPQEDEVNRYFGLMMNAIQKIEKVVGRLLDFSRRDDYRFKQFDVNQAIERALSLVKYQLEKNKVRVEKTFDRKFAVCLGDIRSIEQVILNLLLNAVDAMPEGGELVIRTFRRGNSCCIQIKDSGMGIASENMDKIFDPFFTTKEPGKGTGLGLSVSFNIVKDHGGEIFVDSEPGHGTSFLVTLPLQERK